MNKQKPANNKARVRAIVDEVRNLCDELDNLLVTDHDETETRKCMTARRIKITNGTYKGCTGIVTSKRGSKYWNIKLDNGETTYKMTHNLEILRHVS